MKPFVADVHMHSFVSGHASGTIRELARAASVQGLKLIGITEHGPGIYDTVHPLYFRTVPHFPRLMHGVEVLYGCEVNIRSNGTLSLDRCYLDCLDYACAGLHASCYYDQGIVDNTDNVIACMAHPKVRFITHPVDDRYPLDYPTLVQGAKEFGVALEVNNSALCWSTMRPGSMENYEELLPLCMDHQVPLIVNSDAHRPSAVGDFSMATSLLEWLDVDESLILNQDLDRLKAFLLRK